VITAKSSQISVLLLKPDPDLTGKSILNALDSTESMQTRLSKQSKGGSTEADPSNPLPFRPHNRAEAVSPLEETAK
jgi:hypothetical protein